MQQCRALLQHAWQASGRDAGTHAYVEYNRALWCLMLPHTKRKEAHRLNALTTGHHT